MKNYALKNFYMLETMRQEIPTVDIVSFSVFDTALLYKVFQVFDIYRILETRAFAGFGFMRLSEENELRDKSEFDDISFEQVYMSIGEKNPDIFSAMKKRELELLKEYTMENAFIKQVFNIALQSKKKIFFVAESIFPATFIEELLQINGYFGYDKVFTSGETGKSKRTGKLYQLMMQEEQLDSSRWLHIGSDHLCDVDNARKLGMRACYYQPLRERYWQNKQEILQENEDQKISGIGITDKENINIEKSISLAGKINQQYTQIERPSDKVSVLVSDISMMFNMSAEKIDNIKEYVVKFLQGKIMFQEFWALRDIEFQVYKGEKIGLIGLNGSGKSTILKIISGVLKPTKGTVTVEGSIAPLIELGAGFDPNLSAKENVYLNGAILGYSHKQMEQKYEEIISFAELKEFEDVAIKNFSSGMVARLGFSIATCHVPDVLIIDEILSVGDFEFQKKCHLKMKELTNQGATVLFVSHSASDILEMCDSVVWLERGKMIEIGEAEYIIGKYLKK